MQALFRVPGLNIWLQMGFTIVTIAVYALVRRGRRREGPFEMILHFTVGLAGWFGMVSALLGHLVWADEVAGLIGWLPGSGFQTELGFASLGIGLVGFLSFWNDSFRLPYLITKTVLSWGAAGTHLWDTLVNSNHAPGNAGVVLSWDLLFPVFLWVLYALARGEPRAAETASTTRKISTLPGGEP